MVATARCPDRSQLKRFLSADLPDEDASEIESHLELCDSCASSIHEISSEDPLMKGLRGGAHEPAERQVDALAERFCRALPGLLTPGPGLETTDLAPALSAPDGPGMGVTEEVFDFLAPPEGSGEIGRLGPYRVTGLIGAGGMGLVFRAEDPLLGRPVALKVMKRSLSAGAAARRRFLREAQAIAALEHDHVVAIYQAGEDRGVLFLAMPLLQGETLADRLRREGVLPLPEALRVAREVAEGLDVAHRRGLVHRDIKPANLWLEGGRGRVKILDFGLSRSLEPEADSSQSGQIAGTPHYMSPEQARGSSITPLCDLFSLGCVLYHMTTGRVPFDGPDTLAVLTALAVATPEPPDRLNPGLAPVASALITSLLARDPSARPGSARAVVEAIEAIERSPSPAATPRRRRPAIGLALLVVLGLAGTGAAFGPQVVRILTDKGQLVIETSDPGVRVEVKRGGQLVTIVDPASGRRVDLHAGEYDLELSEGKDGLRLSTRRFALTRGGREVVRVTMERSPAAPPVEETHAAPVVVAALDLRREIDRLTARLRDRPDDRAALGARADAYVKAGDAGRAIADFDEAIRRDPADAAAYEGRAHSRQLTADHLGAIADSDSALRLDPDLTTAHAVRGAALTSLGEWGRGRVALDEFIRRVPREPWSYYHRAVCRQGLGDLDGAVADLNRAIELGPEISRFYGQRGLALAMRHDLGPALEDVERALRSTPNDREFLRLRGWVRAQRGEYGGALADYDRAFEGRPLDATKLADRASVGALAGHYKEAEADFEAALRVEPSNPWIRARRALYLHAARGDHKRAVADCDEALQLSPGHAEASLNRGLSSLALDDFRRAIVDFDRALDPRQGRGITFLGPLSSRYPELYRARSEAHRRLGDLDGAVADLDAALGLDPDDAEARVRRGRLHAARRDFARAIADFDRAIALGRRDADLYRDRGDAVDRLSKPAAK